jgi:hypothetical protein
MKSFICGFFIAIIAITLAGCKVTREDAAMKVAKEFLENLNKNNFIKAKKLATEESKAMIDMLESFSKMDGSTTKTNVIDNLTCIVDGDKATCNYTENGEAKTLSLVEKDGKWLVEMKKETPDMSTSSSSNNNDNNNQNQNQNNYTNNDNNNYQNYGDTTTFFSLVLNSAINYNNTSLYSFQLVNRSEWNCLHYWVEVYFSDKSGKFLGRKELLFNGVMKNELMGNFSNAVDLQKKNIIEISLDSTTAEMVGEIYVLPLRMEMETDYYQRSDKGLNVFSCARYTMIKNATPNEIKITF